VAKKDFQVTCSDHPSWTVHDLTAKQAKETADAHDDEEHNGQSVAQTEKQPPGPPARAGAREAR
jgi:hypothetical protein